MPNIADVRDVGVFELGLALGVSGVVGGGIGEVDGTHWSGLGTVFRYVSGTPNWSNKKVLKINFSSQGANVLLLLPVKHGMGVG